MTITRFELGCDDSGSGNQCRRGQPFRFGHSSEWSLDKHVFWILETRKRQVPSLRTSSLTIRGFERD